MSLSQEPQARARSLANLELGRGGSARWRGKLPVPQKAHPLVRQFVDHANEQKTTIKEIATRAGMRRSTIGSWFHKSAPSVVMLEAALNVLGLELCIRKKRGDS
ncbi:MAG: helix-turn-helix transcriptional regulator [Afipia sp.]|nr:helix-turn-helix transcriptional regulator [Afipia sp.]